MTDRVPPFTDSLDKRIIERCDEDGLPEDHPLRRTAKAFAEARERVQLGGEPSEFTGVWAKARRMWCAYSGEPLE